MCFVAELFGHVQSGQLGFGNGLLNGSLNLFECKLCVDFQNPRKGRDGDQHHAQHDHRIETKANGDDILLREGTTD